MRSPTEHSDQSLGWLRFDLTDSGDPMGLMAQATPAWREPHVAVLDQVIERHTGWWF